LAAGPLAAAGSGAGGSAGACCITPTGLLFDDLHQKYRWVKVLLTPSVEDPNSFFQIRIHKLFFFGFGS
jgi:hypothetical protein